MDVFVCWIVVDGGGCSSQWLMLVAVEKDPDE